MISDRRQCLRATMATFLRPLAAAALGTAGIAAQAQTTAPAGASGLEEIIVTAERRETALQDTPISMSVVGGAQLEAIGAFEILDIPDQIPNIRINRTAGSQSNVGIAIRGAA